MSQGQLGAGDLPTVGLATKLEGRLGGPRQA